MLRRSAFAVLIILAGMLLRFHALDRQSLWDDEMSTRAQIEQPANRWLARFRLTESHPPLYFLQLKAWESMCGPRLDRLRANSAFWGTVALGLFYWLATEIDPADGFPLIATALLAFSPYHLAYSQELRPYAMGVALALLIWTLLARALREKRPTVSILAVGGVLQLYSHYWGGFIWAAQMAYAWIRSREKHQKSGILVALLLVAVLFGFWLPILRDQLHNINDQGFWAPTPSSANLLRTFTAYSGVYFRFASSAFMLPLDRWILGSIMILYLILFGLGVGRRPLIGGIWLALGLGVPFALSYWKPPVYVWYRYPILIYPAFLLICAGGIMQVPSRVGRIILVALLVAIDGVGLRHYIAHWDKANPRAVVSYISQRAADGDVIVRPSYFRDLFAYYFEAPGRRSLVDEHILDSDAVRARLRGRRIWFVCFDVPRDEIRDALLHQFSVLSARDFPGYAHLGVTVYELR